MSIIITLVCFIANDDDDNDDDDNDDGRMPFPM